MVESSQANANFIKLTSRELSAKIALLVSNNGRVVFWKTSPRYFEGVAFSFEVKKNIYLTLDKANIPIRILDKIICINFNLNDIDYYVRGKVIEQVEDNPKITIELEEECFRVEKRSRERLLTYPVYETYVYLKFQKMDKGNVIPFNKNDQKGINFFSEIDNFHKNKIAAMADDLQFDSEEDIVGFRVEDLSSTGLSFFASLKEKALIFDELEKKPFSLVLNFETQIFNLQEAVLVYKMNYINNQFLGVPMYKIGINFKHSPTLKRKIEDIMGGLTDFIDYQKEFEEFIKNE